MCGVDFNMKKSDIVERKFIESYDVSEYEILTDTRMGRH
jgi:hypothetical protein